MYLKSFFFFSSSGALYVGEVDAITSISNVLHMHPVVSSNFSHSKIQTQRFERMLFIRTKHNLHIFGVFLFIKLQIDT